MAKHVFLILSLTLFLATGLLAQQTSPPDGAHLRGIDPIVTLRWPGTAKQKFQVQIYAGRAEVFSQEVTGNVLKVPLRSGPRYRWQVSRKERGGFMQLVSPQSFQLSSELEFNFDGKKGESGKDGHSSSGQGQFRSPTSSINGQDGKPGQNGGNGQDVQVTVSPAGDYRELRIQSPLITKTFLLVDSSPITISTRGGDGGDGGQGGHGGVGYFEVVGNNRFVQARSFPPGIGGDGGAGGEGGRGGNVTVNTSGLKQEVRVDNFGGAGGRGGAGGAGGTAAIIPQYYRGPIPQNYIVNAPPGRPGADGRPGPQGRIFEK